MKILYILLSIAGLLVTGYLITNDFSFDNITFSNYLISTVLILFLSCLAVAGVVYVIAQRRKSATRGMMTIRQYYQYKSAR